MKNARKGERKEMRDNDVHERYEIIIVLVNGAVDLPITGSRTKTWTKRVNLRT